VITPFLRRRSTARGRRSAAIQLFFGDSLSGTLSHLTSGTRLVVDGRSGSFLRTFPPAWAPRGTHRLGPLCGLGTTARLPLRTSSRPASGIVTLASTASGWLRAMLASTAIAAQAPFLAIKSPRLIVVNVLDQIIDQFIDQVLILVKFGFEIGGEFVLLLLGFLAFLAFFLFAAAQQLRRFGVLFLRGPQINPQTLAKSTCPLLGLQMRILRFH
jgi:hypothetical protein